jgi:myo-inositol-1(or 4)-monophosphatase
MTASDREILETALRKGGKVLLDHFGLEKQARIKESISSVLTEADLASERSILEVLTGSGKQCNIISEEKGYLDRGSGRTWVVDPLDGTSNFAAGLPWFGVIIALFEGSIPVLGGMYLPMEDLLYIAEAKKGASRNGLPVRTTESGELREQLVSYSFDFSEDPGTTLREMEIMAKISGKVRNIRSTNSLVDFCYTADGRLGAAMNQTTKIWDIAAPSLIIREAGGTVSNIRGEEIRFDLSPGGMKKNYTILAAGTSIHAVLLETIRN